jgi:acetyl esterase/lipase
MSANPHGLSLEPAAPDFVQATNDPSYLIDLGPEEGRKVVDEVQSSEIFKPAIDEEWATVDAGQHGEVSGRIVRPLGSSEPLPVVLYVHGAGWVFGNAHTHDRLVRDLAVGAQAAVVFAEYDRSPEFGFPVAIAP